MVELADQRPGKLKDIAAVSGERAVFDRSLLQTIEWAARHYVAPLSVLLAKATPPNLPKRTERVGELPRATERPPHPIDNVVSALIAGRRRPTQAMVGIWQQLDWLAALRPLIAKGRSALIVASSAAEVSLIAEEGRQLFGGSLLEVVGESDATLTRAWEAAQAPGRLVIGTPRTAMWMITHLSLVLALEEGRRAMKERQTPTLHVREVLRRRSLVEGFANIFFGPTPSVEVLAAGSEVIRTGNRAWPLVEIVDRSEEPPGSGLVAEPTIAALRAVSSRGEKCFVFTFRKMVDQTVREINARLGMPASGPHPNDRPITVGTERDLTGLASLGLTVASNVDGMLLGAGYRTSEEALRQLARLANALAPGSGHRMMAQVMDPSLPLVETLKRGDPIPYLERVLVERGRAGVPPCVEMIAVELRDHVPETADAAIRKLQSVEVHGPLELENGNRWLLQGEPAAARLELRDLAGRWRESGATVRIDADPIDL